MATGEHIYALVGERDSNSSPILITTWRNMPSQMTIDSLTEKYKKEYIRFAIVEDILFIPGEKKDEDLDYSYFD